MLAPLQIYQTGHFVEITGSGMLAWTSVHLEAVLHGRFGCSTE